LAKRGVHQDRLRFAVEKKAGKGKIANGLHDQGFLGSNVEELSLQFFSQGIERDRELLELVAGTKALDADPLSFAKGQRRISHTPQGIGNVERGDPGECQRRGGPETRGYAQT